jgi:hypothetical protein
VAQEYGTLKRRINSNLRRESLDCYARNLLNCEQLAAKELVGVGAEAWNRGAFDASLKF